LGVPEEILNVNPYNIDYASFHKSLNDFMRMNPDFKRRFFKTGWFKEKKITPPSPQKNLVNKIDKD